MIAKLQERSCSTAYHFHADALLHLKAAPAVGAAELHTVLGHEVWKGSLETGEYSQSEVCLLGITAPEGRDQPF